MHTLIHRTPEIMQHASDPNEHLVQAPRVPRPRSAAARPFAKLGAEVLAPASDAFVGDHNAALSQDQLDVTQAKAEHVIQLHGVADDLSRGAMAVVRTRLRHHPVSFACLSPSHQPRLTGECH
jgi:hypothetical protein